MQGVLRFISGSDFGRVIPLDGSHSVLLGRSEELEISVPGDPLISSRHCKISPQSDGFLLEDLNSTNGTYVNGGQVSRRLLRDGDTIRCGDTEIQVAIDLQSPSRPSSPASEPVPAPSVAVAASPTREHPHHDHAHDPPHAGQVTALPRDVPFSVDDLGPVVGFNSPLAMTIVDRFELLDELEHPPLEAESVDEYLDRLVGEEHWLEALKFLSFALPKRSAVWWATACAQFDPPKTAAANEEEAIALADAWVKAPTEGLRRRSWDLATRLKKTTPIAWLGTAVFWSHGSLTPPENPAVPVPPKLTGVAIYNSVLFASLMQRPQDAPQRQRRFVGLARELASLPEPWKARA